MKHMRNLYRVYFKLNMEKQVKKQSNRIAKKQCDPPPTHKMLFECRKQETVKRGYRIINSLSVNITN